MNSDADKPRRIKVQDRRRVHNGDVPAESPDDRDQPENAASGHAMPEDTADVAAVAPAGESEATGDVLAEHDYLDDLRRLQAEFDNYRKRMMREQTALTARATERLVERLLPVLDNFERALEHGGAGLEGVELVYKQLRDVLGQEGLAEVPAEGVPFDPALHEAVELSEDPAVSEPTSKSVFRRGYRIGDKLLRAAMVTVARPPDVPDANEEQPGPEPAAAGEG